MHILRKTFFSKEQQKNFKFFLRRNIECTSLDDSCVLFGNPNSQLRITILSNPHCNPCARMHKRVERLLKISGNEVCVQYVFSSFNDQLEDSSRYLIACYMNESKQNALRQFARWYSKDKFDYKNVIRKNQVNIHFKRTAKKLQVFLA